MNEWVCEWKIGDGASEKEWAHLQNYIFYLGCRAAIFLSLHQMSKCICTFFSHSLSISFSSSLALPPQKYQQHQHQHRQHHHHFFWHWISSGCSQKISTAAVNVINTNRYLLWILKGNNVISVWLAQKWNGHFEWISTAENERKKHQCTVEMKYL